MGIRLTILAETYAMPQLGRRATDHAARVVLTVMCLSAIDHHPQPWYGGGWPPLARALGYGDLKPLSARPMVSRAMAPLIDAGFIERTYATTYDTRLTRADTARWLIHVGPP